ncbi:hypothetical protein SK128_021227, partial [Halocaridina rubra]
DLCQTFSFTVEMCSQELAASSSKKRDNLHSEHEKQEVNPSEKVTDSQTLLETEDFSTVLPQTSIYTMKNVSSVQKIPVVPYIPDTFTDSLENFPVTQESTAAPYTHGTTIKPVTDFPEEEVSTDKSLVRKENLQEPDSPLNYKEMEKENIDSFLPTTVLPLSLPKHVMNIRFQGSEASEHDQNKDGDDGSNARIDIRNLTTVPQTYRRKELVHDDNTTNTFTIISSPTVENTCMTDNTNGQIDGPKLTNTSSAKSTFLPTEENSNASRFPSTVKSLSESFFKEDGEYATQYSSREPVHPSPANDTWTQVKGPVYSRAKNIVSRQHVSTGRIRSRRRFWRNSRGKGNVTRAIYPRRRRPWLREKLANVTHCLTSTHTQRASGSLRNDGNNKNRSMLSNRCRGTNMTLRQETINNTAKHFDRRDHHGKMYTKINTLKENTRYESPNLRSEDRHQNNNTTLSERSQRMHQQRPRTQLSGSRKGKRRRGRYRQKFQVEGPNASRPPGVFGRMRHHIHTQTPRYQTVSSIAHRDTDKNSNNPPTTTARGSSQKIIPQHGKINSKNFGSKFSYPLHYNDNKRGESSQFPRLQTPTHASNFHKFSTEASAVNSTLFGGLNVSPMPKDTATITHSVGNNLYGVGLNNGSLSIINSEHVTNSSFNSTVLNVTMHHKNNATLDTVLQDNSDELCNETEAKSCTNKIQNYDNILDIYMNISNLLISSPELKTSNLSIEKIFSKDTNADIPQGLSGDSLYKLETENIGLYSCSDELSCHQDKEKTANESDYNVYHNYTYSGKWGGIDSQKDSLEKRVPLYKERNKITLSAAETFYWWFQNHVLDEVKEAVIPPPTPVPYSVRIHNELYSNAEPSANFTPVTLDILDSDFIPLLKIDGINKKYSLNGSVPYHRKYLRGKSYPNVNANGKQIIANNIRKKIQKNTVNSTKIFSHSKNDRPLSKILNNTEDKINYESRRESSENKKLSSDYRYSVINNLTYDTNLTDYKDLSSSDSENITGERFEENAFPEANSSWLDEDLNNRDFTDDMLNARESTTSHIDKSRKNATYVYSILNIPPGNGSECAYEKHITVYALIVIILITI